MLPNFFTENPFAQSLAPPEKARIQICIDHEFEVESRKMVVKHNDSGTGAPKLMSAEDELAELS